MKKMIDGLSLKISEILNESYVDIHGHEITFEKTGKFEYTSVYNINCNRKYIIDLSPADSISEGNYYSKRRRSIQ